MLNYTDLGSPAGFSAQAIGRSRCRPSVLDDGVTRARSTSTPVALARPISVISRLPQQPQGALTSPVPSANDLVA